MSLPQDGGQFLFANGNEQKWKCADNPQDTHTTPRRGLLRRGRLPDRYQPPKGWKRVGMGNVGTASLQNLQQLLDAVCEGDLVSSDASATPTTRPCAFPAMRNEKRKTDHSDHTQQS